MPAFEMSIADLSALVLAVATTISLIYISRQLAVTRRQTKGEFLLALDDQFEKVRDILLKVVGDPTFQPDGKDWPRVWALMSVFERVSIMVEDGIIDVGIVDRLYGYVMLRLLGNDAVFERLKATGADWQDFVELCYRLARRRARSKHPHDRSFADRVHQLSKDTRTANPFSF
jgi:hypothetical protein